MFSYLHKMKVDNAKDYLARKQLKQQKQQKQSDSVAPSSEVSSTTEEGPETKKVKVDASWDGINQRLSLQLIDSNIKSNIDLDSKTTINWQSQLIVSDTL